MGQNANHYNEDENQPNNDSNDAICREAIAALVRIVEIHSQRDRCKTVDAAPAEPSAPLPSEQSPPTQRSGPSVPDRLSDADRRAFALGSLPVVAALIPVIRAVAGI